MYATVCDCQDSILNYKHKGVHIPIGGYGGELASWVQCGHLDGIQVAPGFGPISHLGPCREQFRRDHTGTCQLAYFPTHFHCRFVGIIRCTRCPCYFVTNQRGTMRINLEPILYNIV